MDTYKMESEEYDGSSKIRIAEQKDSMFGEGMHSIEGPIYDAFEGRTGKKADMVHKCYNDNRLPEQF